MGTSACRPPPPRFPASPATFSREPGTQCRAPGFVRGVSRPPDRRPSAKAGCPPLGRAGISCSPPMRTCLNSGRVSATSAAAPRSSAPDRPPGRRRGPRPPPAAVPGGADDDTTARRRHDRAHPRRPPPPDRGAAASSCGVLCGPGVDPHSYARPRGDVIDMQRAEAIVYNGFHLEAQLGEMLEDGPSDRSPGPWRVASPTTRVLDWVEDGEVDPGRPQRSAHLEPPAGLSGGRRGARGTPRLGSSPSSPAGSATNGAAYVAEIREVTGRARSSRGSRGAPRAGQRARRVQVLRGRLRVRDPRGPRRRERPRGRHPRRCATVAVTICADRRCR